MIVYQETFSEEVVAEDLASAQITAHHICSEVANRKLLSIAETPSPVPEEYRCPECIEALPKLNALALQRANLKKAPKNKPLLLGGPMTVRAARSDVEYLADIVTKCFRDRVVSYRRYGLHGEYRRPIIHRFEIKGGDTRLDAMRENITQGNSLYNALMKRGR